MKFDGTVKIPATRETVWQFLSDPAAASQCLPGLKQLQPVVPGRQYRLVLELDLGFLRPTFDLEMVLTQATEPREARLWLRGKGPDSHVGGSSYFTPTDLGDGTTELHWAFFVAAAGWIASMGDWLLANAFRKVSAEFFARVQQRLLDRLDEPVPSLLRAS